ncbi:MAG TPA: amino acid permease [Armatimonadota bacterium]|jgi:APA family basic amino acid/polyamine antiporter
MAMLPNLLRTKSITSEIPSDGHGLKRVLGSTDLIMLGIGGIVGAGIFALVGTAAAGDETRPGAGPALVISFVLTAVACGFAALCYAEFASLANVSGSAYSYAYATLGELVAWIIGWDLILEYAVGNVAVAVSWSGYLQVLLHGFGIDFPKWIATDFRAALDDPAIMASAPRLFGVPIIFNLPAVFIVTALTALLVVGVKESAWFNTIMVGIKLVVLAFFMIIGMFYIKPEHWHPFMPNGWQGVQAGAAVVFFAFIGFDAVSTAAEECRNPKRDLPIGILGSLGICTVIYMLVAVVLTGMYPWSKLNTAEPLSMAMRAVNQDWAAGVVAFGSVIAHTAVLLVFQLGQPRILYAMSRDGLLPRAMSRVHPRFRTPHVATILTGLFVAGASALASLDEMADLCNIGTLSAFVIVCAGVLVLRWRDPHRRTGFRTPWVPLVPILGIASCFWLMLGLPTVAWVRFMVWLIVGLVFYVSYGFWRRRCQAREIGKPAEPELLGETRS